ASLPLALLVGGYAWAWDSSESQLRAALVEADRPDPGWRPHDAEALREEEAVLKTIKLSPWMSENWPAHGFVRGVLDLAGEASPNVGMGEEQIKLLQMELLEATRAEPELGPGPGLPRGGPDVIRYLALVALERAQAQDLDEAASACRALVRLTRFARHGPYWEPDW